MRRIVLMAALALSACSPVPRRSFTQVSPCTSQQAQIAVGDGYGQILCGCAEAAAVVMAPGTLTCTVSAGTYVFFHYFSNYNRHQLLSTGTGASAASSTFLSSPVSDPTADYHLPTYALQFTTAGTYPFEDGFDSALSGQIVAQ